MELLDENAEQQDRAARTPEQMMDLLEAAWGVIANAGGWRATDVEASPGWLPAAEQWRDRYLDTLHVWCGTKAEVPE